MSGQWSPIEKTAGDTTSCFPRILQKPRRKFRGWRPDFGWKWLKWTFGFWSDPANNTVFGIDIGPLEIVWRFEGYRP